MSRPPHRRALLAGMLAAAAFPRSRAAWAQDLPKLVVTKDPTCGCCAAWADHIRAAGFPVEIVESTELSRVKARLGVPQDLASCHTAEVGEYVIEGHVPAEALKRLLAEKPRARGLAVAGMPVGSPGMEVQGMAPETYEVVLFGPDARSTYARYRGARPI